MLRMRARHLAAQNPWISNAIQNWVTSLVGTGIRPTTAQRDAITQWEDWTLTADADGRTDFYGLQAVVARSLVVDGEAFVQLTYDDSGVQARVIPAHLIDDSLSRDLGNGRSIVQGIELDAHGKRVAYHVTPQNYGAAVRVPASDMLHVFKPLMPGQVRGVSWLAPVVLPAAELDDLSNAMLTGVKTAAMFAGIVTDQNGMGSLPFDGTQIGNVLESGLEPGTLKVLPSGYSISFSTPQQDQQTNEFVKHSLRGLAAGLGLPAHLLDGDLSGANYSSLRAGLLPFRAACEQIQYGVLVPQLLNPIWQRVMLDEPCEWIIPTFMQVDPMKAVQADIAEINAGLKSRRQAIAERGWSAEQLDDEIAADKAREKALGIEVKE